ncbi:hypothetical protein PHMEG_0003806 [Phytophthora megakarya]|uniref:Reverse transcriptase n=1 Tax=Phytophthora megakarya TaxID=4795 RepID=A0A225WVA2_9STRA|nr:hypothetical protein PHMEG_0003806 [Phytophthora megakarya]
MFHASSVVKVADLFAQDARGVLYPFTQSKRSSSRDTQDELYLVVPISLKENILYYAHEDFQGGHQSINGHTTNFVLNSIDPGYTQTSIISRSKLIVRVVRGTHLTLAHILEISNQNGHLK